MTKLRIQKPLESVGWLGGVSDRVVIHEGERKRRMGAQDIGPIETLRHWLRDSHAAACAEIPWEKRCPDCGPARQALEDVEALVAVAGEASRDSHQRQRKHPANRIFHRHEANWGDCPDDQCPKRSAALAKFKET